MNSLLHMSIDALLSILLLRHEIQAFNAIKSLSTGAVEMREFAESVAAAEAVLVVEIFADRLQAAVWDWAWTWGGE